MFASEKEYWKYSCWLPKEKLRKSTKAICSNICLQTKCSQEGMGNLCVKKETLKAGIPLSVSEKIFCRVL